MKLRSHWIQTMLALTLAVGLGGVARGASGGLATNVTGLYYTGVNNSYGLLGGATTDSHWSVTYASTDGGANANSTYQGAAYVVNNSNVTASAWTQNTSSAQWIVPPGAKDPNNGYSVNTGGDYLPGNGDTGSKEGLYVYTLAFTITGTGSGTVKNAVSIGLTLSADDDYSVYVNPSGNGTTLPSGTAAASGTSAWDNTASATLQNGTDGTGTSGNSVFKIGTNYLVVVVKNTNGINGSSSSNTTNASGLLVYQVGSAITINGNPIPEVGTWMPFAAGLALYGMHTLRRSRKSRVLSV